MAVVEELPGVEITVRANKQPLEEHEEPDAQKEPRTVTRYIAAQSGQTFDVCIKVAKGTKFEGDVMSFEIYVDGKKADAPLLWKEECAGRKYKHVSRGKDGDNGELFLYRFDALELVSDGKLFHHEVEVAKELGSVKIEVSHENQLRRTRGGLPPSVHETDIVSEKVLAGRAITQSVGFTKAKQRIRKPKYWDTSLVDPSQPVAGTFVFKYRSMEGLKTELIVPRSPSPPPIEERTADSLSLEEIMELQRHMRNTKGRQTSIKREIKDEDDHANPPPPRKKHRPHAGDTQLELGDDGSVRQTPTTELPPQEREIIELD